MKSIIPGLIDDLGRECLIRIPYQEFPTAISVSKTWESEIRSPEFRRLRKSSGVNRPVIVLAQAKSDDPNMSPDQEAKQHATRPIYRLTASDPVSGTWTELPEIPGLPAGLPVFCGVVGVGSDLVVMGGWDPVTLQASSSVYVYSFLSGQWRRGSYMPGVKRSFFGCASDTNRTVLVAGGHDEDKNALRSALLYDVAEDKWVPLDDMAKERDECKVIFHRGRFHVISGYPTENQGCFERSAEAFDPATWQWGPVIEDFLDTSAGPGSCVAGPGERVYACVGQRSGDVAVQQGDKWQLVAKVPPEVRSSQWLITYGDTLMVIGSPKIGQVHEAYMLDLKSYKWNKIDMPKEFCGHVQSRCVMEL